MGIKGARPVLAMCFAALLLVLVVIEGVGEGVTTVLTSTGTKLVGSLSGISPMIRLAVPTDIMFIGPRQAFDIPLAKVRQITLDFPRVVVETKDRVYVGPFADFRGIPEELSIRERSIDHSFYTASLRAIALHGETIHPVPREWLVNEFLSLPITIAVPPAQKESETAVATTPTEKTPQTWSDLYPTTPAPKEEQETPLWISLLVAVAVVGLIYFGVTGSK